MSNHENLETQSKTADQLFKIRQVCERLSISKSSLYRLINDGHLPEGTKIPFAGVRWRESDIQSFIDEYYK
ncbi:hypothetical protein BWR19_07030 [Halomonas sp. 1513]|nr:hypothetical protein BWR19_07030 [Halomonas sp. 1513]